MQVQGKHSMREYFGRVERKESGSADVLAETARPLRRFWPRVFPTY